MTTISSSLAAAQGGELFGGYSYLRSTSGIGYNANGWEGSLTGNFNRVFGLEVDIGHHYNFSPESALHSNGLSFLFGPHFAYRRIPRVNPFVHFLVGGTRGETGPRTITDALCPSNGCPTFPSQSQTAFTAGVGGGVDVKATRFVWIRVVQADYLREYFSGDVQNNPRISFGVVLRFGR